MDYRIKTNHWHNFPNAQIFSNVVPLGGGDGAYYPFIRLNNSYCQLSHANIMKIFAPIKTAPDAIQYYVFEETIVGPRGGEFILAQEDYGKIIDLGNCTEADKEKIKNHVTEAIETSDGFEITFVMHQFIGENKFFERKIKVKFTGATEFISDAQLLNCGQGGVF